MRIAAGSKKGRRLEGAPGTGTRAVTARVKESVFDILSGRVEGASVLDCFAGTGSFGIEALSRGASRAVFVDSSRDCADIIRRNLSRSGLRAEVYCCTVLKALREIGGRGVKFDIIFLDPPFESACGDIGGALCGIDELGLAAEGAVAVMRHHFKTVLPEFCGGFRFLRKKRYGENLVQFYTGAGEGMTADEN